MNRNDVLAESTILISHAKEQEGLVNRVRRKLQNYPATFVTVGFEIEKKYPFQNFWKPALAREIKRSDIVLLILSEKWVHSPICMAHFSLAKEAGKKVIAVLSSPMDFQPLTPDISVVDLTKDESGAIEGLLEKVEDALGPKYTVNETNQHQLSDQSKEIANSDRWKQRSSFWQMQFLTALVVGCSILIYGAAVYKNAAFGRSDRQTEYTAAHFSGKKMRVLSVKQGSEQTAIQESSDLVRVKSSLASKSADLTPEKQKINGIEISDILANFSREILTGGGERLALQLALEVINPESLEIKSDKQQLELISALYSGIHQLDSGSVLKGHSATVFGIAFDGQGQKMVSVSRDGTLRIWDYTSRKFLKQIVIDNDYAHAVSISKDGKQIAVALKNGSLGIWDVNSGKSLNMLRKHKDELYRVVHSFDGSLVATASRDNTAIIWNSTNWEPVFQLFGHEGTVWSVSFSPDSELIATSSQDKTVRLWNVNTGHLKSVLRGHSGDVYSVTFSPDGKNILTASSDGTVRIWDTKRGTEIKVLQSGKQKMLSAAYSPDGRRIVAVGYENVARIWDSRTYKLDVELNAGNEKLLSVKFSPQSDSIVTTSVDGTVRLWRLFSSTKELVAEAISQVAENCLTKELRGKFLLPYKTPAWCRN